MQTCRVNHPASLLFVKTTKKVRYIIFTLFILTSLGALAQEGQVRGMITDGETGETLVGVTVFAVGTTSGTITDIDGKFSLKLAAGTYNLQVSYISYQTVTVSGLEVAPGEVTVIDNLRMHISKQELEEVVITAEQVRTTETALVSIKRKAPAILDGISESLIRLTGDGTAVEAAKRVTGVSIEDGKYVYVRGLGDRYAKTTLNGMDIPGLDPDRNTLQMDIFPSNLIANILVSKNFTANMPADFTGGLMNIELKDFPDRKIRNISVGTTYNPDMHFNAEYLTYQGSGTDFLGFDGGDRALPAGAGHSNIPTPISGNSPDEVNSFIKSFNPTLSAMRKQSPLDFSASISLGSQVDLSNENGGPEINRKLGYIFSLSYKSEFRYYDDVVFGEYQRYIDPDRYEMRYATISEGELGKKNFLVGLLGGLAYKTNYSKIRFTLMHLQNGESTAGIFNVENDGAAVGQSGYQATSHNLEYNQRSITNIFLNGSRKFGSSGWDIDWRIAPTLSRSKDPDIRKTAFTLEYDGPTFNAGAGGNPSRIWRYLSEWNVPARVDLSRGYALNDKDGKISFGASQTYKYRSYQILYFDVQFFGQQPNWTGDDPSQVLAPENIFPGGKIYYQSGNSNPNPNAYTSNVSNTAAYLSNELELFTGLKTILGVRAEYYVQRHTGRDITYATGDVTNGQNLDNEKVLESLDLFPSINLILSLTDAQNLRAAYSRTIARPSFKELSFAQIIDPITNRIFNGALFTYSGWNGNLTETRIDNLDLRWEYFMDRGQMFSVSGFMKSFNDPIELVRIPEQQTSTEYQPRNVGDGRLVGVEFEIRKNLGFLASFLGDFNFSSNITLVESQISMTDVEYNSRESYLKTGETLARTRQMAGQSPYVINTSITYANYDLGLDAGIFYNVKGPTLYIVGGGLFPDIYNDPFHSLNVSFNKKFGKQQQSSIDFKINNILNDENEIFYQSYKASDQVFERMVPGRSFSIGFGYKF